MNLLHFAVLVVLGGCFAAPTRSPKQLLLLPNNGVLYAIPWQNSQQVRGPFDFLGNLLGSWIQSSEWFPVEVNVPDSLAGVGQFAQNVGGNIQNFGQNVGSGLSGFAQNFGGGIRNATQNFGNFFNNNRPQAQPVRYFLVQPSPRPLHFNPFPLANFPNFP